ncbi:hypothetical protein [Peribacillus frigoritolerans]|uniref:hypothetical protein n=1 Tax=Peribacillus frigoritolerans TaxID=450367 RepID=UPI0039A15A44
MYETSINYSQFIPLPVLLPIYSWISGAFQVQPMLGLYVTGAIATTAIPVAWFTLSGMWLSNCSANPPSFYIHSLR